MQKSPALPVAVNGVLDLTTWQFSDDDPLPLNGDWEFYPGLLLETRTQTLGAQGAHMVLPVPGTWKRSAHATDQVEPNFGTYRLLILLPPGTHRLGLRAEGIYTAAHIYANGIQVGSSGRVGDSAPASRPDPYPFTADCAVDGGNLELLIPVSNFHFREGGIRKPILLGTPAGMRGMERNAVAYSLFLTGAFALVGVYHIFLFVLRGVDKSPLFFGIHCLAIALRQVTTGEGYLMQLFPGPGYPLHLALDYSTMPVAAFTFMLFVRSLYPREIHRSLNVIFGICAAALLVTAAVVPTVTLTRLVAVYQTYLFLGGAVCLVAIGLAAKRGREGSLLFIAGAVVLYIGTANDVLVARGWLRSGDYGSLGLLLFIGTQAALLSIRHAKAFRTVERLSKELVEKNVELKRLDELKDEFLANTSHELRTPLNGIIGLAEALLQGSSGEIPAQARTDLRLVAASGRRLTNLVNDVLDFSRLRNGDIDLRSKAVDIASIGRLVLALCRPLAANKKVELVDDLDGTPAVYGDEERIEQILHNLVGNAIKFTKEGVVRVSARAVPGHVPMLEISVSDSGIGIPPEKQEMIFQAFTQADGSISREYGGTGLGLSITRTLVELHGGSLNVESTPGHGSRFYFTIPLASENGTPLLGAGERTTVIDDVVAIPKPGVSQARTGRKVLIVDDDPVNLRVLETHLALAGHTVVQAPSGRAALEELERDVFDLILLDVMMPGLSGYDVCKLLRQHHSPSELPVIMLTARNRIEDLVAGLDSGANDYLSKPFDSRELMARVNTMMALRSAARHQSELATINSELQLAHELQQSLLPRTLPDMPQFKIAARYRSMARVGGDFYDMRQADNGLAVLISDVSGHGVPAALVVSMVKLAFWFQKDSLRSPEELFTSMNEILYGNIGTEFVTACYTFLDPEKRVLITGSAGHPHLLIRRKGGSIEAHKPKGRILGPFQAPEFQSEETTFAQGDRILFYTDGVIEASPPDAVRHFGMQQLQSFIEENHLLEAEAFSDHLLQTLIDWSGGASDLADDIAFVVIDVL